MNFKSLGKKGYDLPMFFPDATRGVVKTVDNIDLVNTKTPGILVNTWHLYSELGDELFKYHKNIREFMNWKGAIISDSGGFQIMSIAKKGNGKVIDEGVVFHPSRSRRVVFTPEKSMEYQFKMKTDLVVVLDDFTPPGASYEEAKETVNRTIQWAKRSKETYQKLVSASHKPYIIAVVQGGDYIDLREYCINELNKIGFDGYGYGGWPMDKNNVFNVEIAKIIADNSPSNYLLYGLGIGKPEDIIACHNFGFQIFDCVLPTRDGRHGRLYVYNAKSIEDIDITKSNFYSTITANKFSNLSETRPVSTACDCLLCSNYSRGYLAHLFKIKDATALRLATIHNLRFYSLLMENLRINK